ncbi:MAG: glycosyl hydrolase [Candidatus Cohnella colombiensis]|uniref:Glycosyl hydrolase n=1 Tax=Candidatus Cohnella colombiensis TaxID=3121368 RepID=A0AA95ET18_9BACL|nr:MAG: glycosyl hydrolase [Cohnella sp.]
MKRSVWLLFLTVSLVFTAIASVSAHTVSPVNSSSTQKTKDTLNWLAHLPNRASGKVLSGFFGGYSNNGFSTSQLNSLVSATGQYPGIFGCDYGAGWATASDPTTLINYNCNSDLKSYFNSGGLVTVNIHYPSPGNATGGNLNTKLTNFSDLLNTSTATGSRWKAYLDKTAAGLQDLKNSGVTVLFRPFHEMNGDWFWWGNQDATTFKNVWINMYNYFTNTKGLNNLIWVYAPDYSRGNRTSYYPGSSYVDIVGLDAYSDNPSTVTGYSELTALGKPFAFTEIGPSTTGASFDYTKWITAIKNNFPATVYFFAWNDGWSPVNNSNAYAFMNDSAVVNRSGINLSSITESGGGGGGTATLLYGFENTTSSWSGSGVTGGPWSINEWAASGSYSLKADIALGSGQASLFRQSAHNFSGKTTLKATVKHASWGSQGSGMQAKLYVKTGSSNTWFDGGTVTINSNSTVLTLNLSNVTNLSDVREVGVQFLKASNSSGTSAIYVDNVTIQ